MPKYFGGAGKEEKEDKAGVTESKTTQVKVKAKPGPTPGPVEMEVEEEGPEDQPVGHFVEAPTGAKVVVSCGLTIAIGKYEFARPTVTLELPCTAETKDEAFDVSYAWVSEKLAFMRQEIEDALAPAPDED